MSSGRKTCIGHIIFRDLGTRNVKKFLVVAFMLMAAQGTIAHEFSAKTIRVDHLWAKPTHSSDAPGLVYFKVQNNGTNDDTLLKVTIDDEIATGTQLRHIDRSDGKRVISHLPEGLALAAGTSAADGYYVLMTGLTERLVEGRRFPIKLIFEHAGEIEVEVFVETVKNPDLHPVAARHNGKNGR